MFDCEIRGQLAMLMGGRAAEQSTCAAVSTGAVDDIRRATDLAYKAVSEFGLSREVGPLNVGVLAAGGSEEGSWLMKDSGRMAQVVEAEVQTLLQAALTVALDVVLYNRAVHDGLSQLLTKQERVEGEQLGEWLAHVKVPDSLRAFILQGRLPERTYSGKELQDMQDAVLAEQQLARAALAASSSAASSSVEAGSSDSSSSGSGALPPTLQQQQQQSVAP
jgi:cell division protease FtsH